MCTGPVGAVDGREVLGGRVAVELVERKVRLAPQREAPSDRLSRTNTTPRRTSQITCTHIHMRQTKREREFNIHVHAQKESQHEQREKKR
jgi:hypothetical protein